MMAAGSGSPFFGLWVHFWERSEQASLTPVARCLYLYLLEQANRAFWPEELTLRTRALTDWLGVTRKTIAKARRQLQEAGLIVFTGGKDPATAATYRLVLPTSKKRKNRTIPNSGSVSSGNTTTPEAFPQETLSVSSGNTTTPRHLLLEFNKLNSLKDARKTCARARGGEILERLKRGEIETLAAQMGLDEESFLGLAEETATAWEAAGMEFDDPADATLRMINTIRIKARDRKPNNHNNPNDQLYDLHTIRRGLEPDEF